MNIADTSQQDVVIQKKSHRGWYILAGCCVVLTVVLIFFPSLQLWSSVDRSLERERVRFATVTRGELVKEIAVEGRIRASSYPTLFSPAQGRISLTVRAGDLVRKGQILARIDSPELNNMLQQEAAAVAAEEAEMAGHKITVKTTILKNRQDSDLKKLRHEIAIREHQRAKRSFDQGLINKTEFDQAHDDMLFAEMEHRHAVEQAKLEAENLELETQTKVEQLERQRLIYREAERRVAELNMTSPVEGVIGNLNVEPNDIVAENRELMTVVDLSAFEVRIEIPEIYADEIRIDSAAEIEYEGRSWQARVSAVSPEVDRSLVEGTLVFEGEAPANLRQNQRVGSRIILARKANVLKVRRGPFVENGGGRRAYVVDEQTARLKPIRIGAISLTEVEIQEGLAEGDEIIISDTSQLGDAATVLLK